MFWFHGLSLCLLLFDLVAAQQGRFTQKVMYKKVTESEIRAQENGVVELTRV